MLAAASLVFGALSSAGQGRMQDLLWCCSVVLCFSSALVFPLAFSVPFGRLAAQLSRSGAAVAGQYGAADLASSRRIVVTDGDLFPLGSVGINDIKLYGEEQDHALAYAAALAIPAGGAMGRLFEGVCRSARIRRENLEHFHIHEHGGLSGMIHGETVLAGPPVFMRHMAVRLPGSMPAKPCMCLAVDGTLTAVFILRYSAAETVSTALRGLGRSGVQLTLGTRDGNITSKLLRSRFHTDGGANTLELDELLALSDPARESDGPSGLLYREGLLPYASLVTGSRRLCQTAAVGDLVRLEPGRALPERTEGACPVYGAQGPMGCHGDYFLESPTLVIPREAAACLTAPRSWVTDGAWMAVRYLRPVNPAYLALMLNQVQGDGPEGLRSLEDVCRRRVPLPDAGTQDRLMERIYEERAAVEASRTLAERFEEKLRDRLRQIWRE